MAPDLAERARVESFLGQEGTHDEDAREWDIDSLLSQVIFELQSLLTGFNACDEFQKRIPAYHHAQGATTPLDRPPTIDGFSSSRESLAETLMHHESSMAPIVRSPPQPGRHRRVAGPRARARGPNRTKRWRPGGSPDAHPPGSPDLPGPGATLTAPTPKAGIVARARRSTQAQTRLSRMRRMVRKSALPLLKQ